MHMKLDKPRVTLSVQGRSMVTVEDAAKFLDVTPTLLSLHRSEGRGCPYYRMQIGRRRIWYDADDLIEFKIGRMEYVTPGRTQKDVD